MKIQIYQVNDQKNEDLKSNNFISQTQALLSILEDNKESSQMMIELDTTLDIDTFYKRCLSKKTDWNKNLPEGAKYFGNENGEESISVGDFLISDDKTVYMFSPSRLEKLDDNLSKKIIDNLENKDVPKNIIEDKKNPKQSYIEMKMKDVGNFLEKATNMFLPSIFDANKRIISDVLNNQKPNLSEKDRDFLSAMVSKKMLESGTIIGKNKIHFEDIQDIYYKQVVLLEKFDKKHSISHPNQ